MTQETNTSTIRIEKGSTLLISRRKNNQYGIENLLFYKIRLRR